MQKGKPKKRVRNTPGQKKPGLEGKMSPAPVFESEACDPVKMLLNKAALISGGDSGIGRAVAVAFAKHGADVAICYLAQEEQDAKFTRELVEQKGRKCLLIRGDITNERHCITAVKKVYDHYGRLDILVNNAGIHSPQEHIHDISTEQLKRTFEVNVFSMFYLVKAALKYMKEGASIINTTSVTAYRGSLHLIDYAATKGAVVSFTRSLASLLADKKIRVNAVAPGPVWTPLIVSSMRPKDIKTFGSDCPMGRIGQPAEIAPAYVFLAGESASFITGQVIHPNGGEIING